MIRGTDGMDGRDVHPHWEVFISCRDCDAIAMVRSVRTSTTKLEGEGPSGDAMLLIRIPDRCHECRNLRPVGSMSVKSPKGGG